MFERASRLKLRFRVENGVVSTEDLWALSLQALDTLAKTLNKEIQDREVSFIEAETKEDAKLTLAFDIVKHIISVRLADREAAKNKTELDLRRKRLEAILADKQDEALKNMSAEDIQKELDAICK